MQNVSIFLPESSLKRVALELNHAFPEATVVCEPAADHWNQGTITRRSGWFSKDILTLSVRSVGEADFAPMIGGMANFVSQLPARSPTAQTQLLARIQSVRVALGVTGTKPEKFEQGLFVLAARLDGFLFVDGTDFRRGDGKLLLNTAGDSDRAETDVLFETNALARPEGSASQESRRQRSIHVLQAEGIPFINHLPVVAAEETVVLRSREAVAQRALAVCMCALKAEGLEAEHLYPFIDRFSVSAFFTPEEQHYMQAQEPTEPERTKFGWRYEGLTVLLWALSYLDELPFPDEICDVAGAVGILRDTDDYAGFLAGATLRGNVEVLDQLDLTYRLHWACVNARVTGKPAPEGVEPGVVYERHYALNWLTNYFNQAWDDVSTET